jgi:cell division protease FtsH
MDRAELMNRMAMLLGGRAAESLVFEKVSTGAGDDLAKASDIARSMVVRYGMDPTLGQVAYEPESVSALGMPTGADWRPRQYGEQTVTATDTAVRELIDTAFQCVAHPDGKPRAAQRGCRSICSPRKRCVVTSCKRLRGGL